MVLEAELFPKKTWAAAVGQPHLTKSCKRLYFSIHKYI